MAQKAAGLVGSRWSDAYPRAHFLPAGGVDPRGLPLERQAPWEQQRPWVPCWQAGRAGRATLLGWHRERGGGLQAAAALRVRVALGTSGPMLWLLQGDVLKGEGRGEFSPTTPDGVRGGSEKGQTGKASNWREDLDCLGESCRAPKRAVDQTKIQRVNARETIQMPNPCRE